MIKIEFSLAISVIISLAITLVFVKWIFYNYYRNENGDDDSQYVQQCPFCTYVFLDYHKETVKMCPNCKSLITNKSP